MLSFYWVNGDDDATTPSHRQAGIAIWILLSYNMIFLPIFLPIRLPTGEVKQCHHKHRRINY